MNSLMLENYEVSIFNFTLPESTSITVWNGNHIEGRILSGATPLDIITEFTTTYSGTMQPLPDWTQHGAIVAVEGGSSAVSSHVDDVLKANVTVVGVFVQDWAGEVR